jgi:hypothetical protein
VPSAVSKNREEANSQEVTPSPDTSLQGKVSYLTTNTPNNFNGRDIRKQIQAGAQVAATSKTTDDISAIEAIFEVSMLQIRWQHQQLSEVAKTTSDLRNGQIGMSEEGHREVTAYETSWSTYNPWRSQFYEHGIIEQKKKDTKAADAYVQSLEAHDKELRLLLEQSQTMLNEARASFTESQKLRKEADRTLEQARELTAANKEPEARIEAEKSQRVDRSFTGASLGGSNAAVGGPTSTSAA